MNKTLGLDDELTLRAEFGNFENAFTGELHPRCWMVQHELVDDDGDCGDSIDLYFAREQDCLRAIDALKAAGFTTARKLWFEREERNRIIGEAMAW